VPGVEGPDLQLGGVMGRRVPMIVVSGLDQLEGEIAAAPNPVVLVFDADNTLVPQGASIDHFQREVVAAVERFGTHPNVRRVIVLTNGPDRGVPDIIHRGNKPWTTRRRLDLEGEGSVWVVGDQVLTDGVLAWRIGARYVSLAIDVEHESPAQARMRRIGRMISPLFFVS